MSASDELAELMASELGTPCECPQCSEARLLQLRTLVRRVNEGSDG
jgi:hypothetical protein